VTSQIGLLLRPSFRVHVKFFYRIVNDVTGTDESGVGYAVCMDNWTIVRSRNYNM